MKNVLYPKERNEFTQESSILQLWLPAPAQMYDKDEYTMFIQLMWLIQLEK